MKRYMRLLEIIFLLNICFFSLNAIQAPYDIQITTYGDDALVQAIQQYSNLTKSDVDRWKFSWAPFVGDYIRGTIVEQIRNFVRTCQGLIFVHSWFQSEADLLGRLPANWDSKKVCPALKNMEKQADYALALLGQIGAITDDEKQWMSLISQYIRNIQYNQNILKCSQLKQVQVSKAEKKLRAEKSKMELNKLYWKNIYLKWKMAKDVSKNLYKGAQWLMQVTQENSAPLLSAATAWFLYNKVYSGLFVAPTKK